MSIQCSVSLEMSVVGDGYYPSLMFLNPSGSSPHTSTKFLPRLLDIIAVENGQSGATAGLRRLCVRQQRVSFSVYTEFGPFHCFSFSVSVEEQV